MKSRKTARFLAQGRPVSIFLLTNAFMAGLIDRGLAKLLTVNCLFFAVAGIVAIAFGILTEVKYGDILGHVSYGDLSTPANYFAAAPALLITGGVSVFLISACGWWGSKEGNIFLMKIYQGFLFVSLVFFFIMGLLAYVHTPSLEYMVMSSFEILFQAYNTTRDTIDYLHRAGKCCGVATFLDWSKDANWLFTTSSMSMNGSSTLPPSCCIDPDDVIKEWNVCDTASLHYQDGCGKLTWLMLESYAELIESLGVAVAVALFVGLLLSSCILRRIYDDDSDDADEIVIERATNNARPVSMGRPLPVQDVAPNHLAAESNKI